MATQPINIGTNPDDGTGDTLRDAGQKINDNCDELSDAISVVSQALSVETDARVAADDALSTAISVVSNSVSILSNTNSAEHAALSGRITSVAGLAGGGSVTSDELSAVSAQAASAINAVSHAVSVLSNQNSVEHAALSLRIDAAGGGGSVTSAEVQVASAAATSADAHANTVSAAVNVVSAALANEISVRASAVSAVSHAVSVLSQANSVAHAALSNAISAVSAALSDRASVLSQAISVLSNTNSAEHAALSAAIAAIPGGGSARDRTRWITVANSTATSVLGNISGLSMAVSAGGLYQMEARLLINRANTSTVLGLGLTFPAMKRVRGAINMVLSNTQSVAGTISSRPTHNAFNGDSASGSVILSAAPVSLTYLSTQAMISGVFFASAGGVIQLQGRGSATGGGGNTFLEGSYIRVIRIN